MWYVFSCNSVEHQTLFQSGWFIEGLLSESQQNILFIEYQRVKYFKECNC